MRLEATHKELIPRGFNLDFSADLLVNGGKESSLLVDYGGDVTIERDAAVRRRSNLVVPGLDQYLPLEANDPLFPSGKYEVKLWADYDFYGRATAKIPLGVFRITKPKTTFNGDGDRAISFEGYDRSKTVAAAKLTSSLTIPAGADIGDLVQSLVEERLPPGVDFNFQDIDSSGTLFTPYTLQWDQGSDVWAKSVELFGGWGYDLYFDEDGACTSTEFRSRIHDTADFVHVSGESATIKKADRILDDENSFNHIIVRAENTDSYFEIFGEAWDNDPNSPTYIGGETPSDPEFGRSPFGDRVSIITNQFVQTNAQAHGVAWGELSKTIGIEEGIETESLWVPHDVTDLVWFILPEMGVFNTYVLDAVKLPLLPEGSVQLTTRRRRTEGV